jgi:hypothetical protein
MRLSVRRRTSARLLATPVMISLSTAASFRGRARLSRGELGCGLAWRWVVPSGSCPDGGAVLCGGLVAAEAEFDPSDGWLLALECADCVFVGLDELAQCLVGGLVSRPGWLGGEDPDRDLAWLDFRVVAVFKDEDVVDRSRGKADLTSPPMRSAGVCSML